MAPAAILKKMLQNQLLVKALVTALLGLETDSANPLVDHSNECWAFRFVEHQIFNDMFQCSRQL